MKGMASAKEYYQAPPPGRYWGKITLAEATFSKAGTAMIHLSGEVRRPEQFAGAAFDDYLITDGNARGGGLAKTKFRGLGIDVSSDAEIPDAEICNRLLGLELDIEFDNEPRMGESVKGSKVYDKEMTVFDEQLGKDVVLNRLIVRGYYRHAVGQTHAHAPAQQAAPQYVQAPVHQAPSQFAQAPQYVQASPQFAPQQFAGGMPMQATPQQAPQQFQAPTQGAVPPWAQPGNGTQGAVPPWAQGAPVETEHAEGGKRRGRPSKNA